MAQSGRSSAVSPNFLTKGSRGTSLNISSMATSFSCRTTTRVTLSASLVRVCSRGNPSQSDGVTEGFSRGAYTARALAGMLHKVNAFVLTHLREPERGFLLWVRSACCQRIISSKSRSRTVSTRPRIRHPKILQNVSKGLLVAK